MDVLNQVYRKKAIFKKEESILYIFFGFWRKKTFKSHTKTVEAIAKAIDDGFD